MLIDPVIPILWIGVIALVMIAATLWFYARSARHLSLPKSVTLMVARLIAVLIIVVLLLQPYEEKKVYMQSTKRQIWLAVDESLSMNEPHQNGASRIDAVKQDLAESGLMQQENSLVKFFTFADQSHRSTAAAIAKLQPAKPGTRFHHSLSGIVQEGSYHFAPSALILFTDGHDFEMVAPGETARRAVERGMPIYAVPYGTIDSARDVSLKLANFHPHAYIKQKTRMDVIVRSIGYPQELIQVKLLCDGKLVQTKQITTNAHPFQMLSFDVMHEEPGQYEYSFQIDARNGERELSNNVVNTYLNVISERLRILEIEGRPFWDSTFLRRSFTRNDKFDIDSLVAFTNDRVRPIRSNVDRKSMELQVPATVDDFKPYNMVIFGRNVEKVLGKAGIEAAEQWVRLHGGIVIFSRGSAWEEKWPQFDDFTPVAWDTSSPRGVRMELTRSGAGLPPCRIMKDVIDDEQYPEITAFETKGKALAMSDVLTTDNAKAPVMVYRRYGNGQTLSLGAANLWRWVFHPQTEYQNNSYDRFWDQMALWLLANGGMAPQAGYSFHVDRSNLPLGESMHAVFSAHGIDLPANPPVVSVFRDDVEVTQITMTPRKDREDTDFEMNFEPADVGRYRFETTAPEGKKMSSRFVVNREDWESLETSMDVEYLEQLTTASGGRVLSIDGVKDLIHSMQREAEEIPPSIEKVPLWDQMRYLYCIAFFLSIDWLLRRRWGLT
jgi:hypothetical protein